VCVCVCVPFEAYEAGQVLMFPLVSWASMIINQRVDQLQLWFGLILATETDAHLFVSVIPIIILSLFEASRRSIAS